MEVACFSLKAPGSERCVMGITTLLIIVLILILIGALPAWPHSRSWGYAPTGLIGTILLIVVILVLMRVI
jgi:hypothetical protein